MYRKYKERHFVTHTLEHLLGVLVIVASAAAVAYFASAQTTLTTSVVTSTVSPSTPTLTSQPVTTTSISTTGDSVFFAVTPAPETDCSGAQPMTKVFFAVSTALGGSFEVTSDTGMLGTRLEWGEYPLPNGKYTWKGIANSGFIPSGTDSGSFELRGTCLTSLSNTNGWMTASSPLDYPETSLLTPQVFLGTSPISSGGTVSNIVNFSLASLNASRIGFALVSAQFGTKFFGGDEGVANDPTLHTWKLSWNSASVPNGDYVLVAIGDTSEGVLRSAKFLLHVANVAPVISSGTAQHVTADISVKTSSNTLSLPSSPDTQTLPRPILKVFFDNKPLTYPNRIFNDEDIELRVIVSLAKKVTLVAIDEHTHTVTQLGNGVIDDLLTTPGMDIWTYVWSAAPVEEGSYNVFARVLRTDGTTIETVPVSLHIMHHTAPSESQTAADTPTPSSTAVTPGERQQILDRVSDPAACTNAEECKIFCTSHREVKDECAQFARVNISTPHANIPSLSDGVPDEQIQLMLHDPRKRPKELPEIIVAPDDFRSYCAQFAHTEVCTKALTNNDLASSDTLEQKKIDITSMRKEDEHLFTERVGARMFVDGDNDGITDYDEVNIYHTDPNDPDTDHDGFLDGAEILAGTNPRGTKSVDTSAQPLSGTSTEQTRASEEMDVENPLVAGAVQSALLAVTDVSAAEIGLNEKGTTTAKKLKLSGKALPNSFVRLYIYSDPIVVTVKADESGAWTYVLDKELPDGTHQVISAITDSGGRILAKSEPLPFVKEAAAVSVGTLLLPQAPEAPGFFSGASLYAFIAIIIALLGLGLSVIGFMAYRKGDIDGQTPAS